MDSYHRSEDIELPNFDDKPKYDNNGEEYNNDNNNPDRKKKKIIIAILVIVGVIVLGVIIFLVIYFSSKKKENGGTIKIMHVLNVESLDSKNEFNIFNAGNLKKDDYTITYNIDNDATYASKKRILVNDGYTITDDGRFIFNDNKMIFGKIEFTIKFKTVLTRTDGMFKDLKSLYSVDLSQFKSEVIKYMNHMFTNCENLNNVNFKNFNSKNVETMESAFENCINLIELDLSSFKTPKLKKLTKTFKNCTNLGYLNLANFELNSNIVDREDIFTDVKNLEQLIINNDNTQTLLYTAGNITIDNTPHSPENCKSENENGKCTKCNDGYYLYSNMVSKCLKCPEECQKCETIFICTDCKIEYAKSLNKCIPKDLVIESDSFGEEEEESGYKIEV